MHTKRTKVSSKITNHKQIIMKKLISRAGCKLLKLDSL